MKNPKTKKLEVHIYVASLSSLSMSTTIENPIEFHESEPVYSRSPIHKKLAQIIPYWPKVTY